MPSLVGANSSATMILSCDGMSNGKTIGFIRRNGADAPKNEEMDIVLPVGFFRVTVFVDAFPTDVLSNTTVRGSAIGVEATSDPVHDGVTLTLHGVVANV